MPWHHVTMQDLLNAMKECDHYGKERFRTRYGPFQRADNRLMSINGRGEYEARPLLAAAYAYNVHHAGRMLVPTDFMNNDAIDFLEATHGFVSRRIR